MKKHQYNILGGVDEIKAHPQFKEKTINKSYYGSELNKFAAEKCRKDIVVNSIDLIIHNYKNKTIKIVESKHKNEKLSTGQKILLQKLSKMGIKTYVVYGDYPYKDNKFSVYSFQTNSFKYGTAKDLARFLEK